MKEKLEGVIREFLVGRGVDVGAVNFVVEAPTDAQFGDYTTNVALACSKQLGLSPRQVAEELVAFLSTKSLEGIEDMSIAGPGFVNIRLSPSYIAELLPSVSKPLPVFVGSKFFVEHTQPNPFKEFHIGHLMNNAIGESIVRLLKASGADVKTASYHGDKGLHVAKAIWAHGKGVPLMESYAAGNKAFDENEEARAEIVDLNKEIYAGDDMEVMALYEKGMKHFKDQFVRDTELLGSRFDYMFLESEVAPRGVELVRSHTPGVFEESEGATIFRGENFVPKTHTRVFISSEGIPTYEAKELGLAELKKEIFDYDQSITITGNEQDGFFKVVEVAIGEVIPDRKGKLHHLSHGMLRLPDGKMSSRTGNIITAQSLIDEVGTRVREKMKDRELPHQVREESVRSISVGAIKYSILKQSIGSDIVFDFNTSLSFEGDSGPYLQYAAVRAQSLLEKAHAEGLTADTTLPSSWSSTSLERTLIHFPEVVARAASDYAPQRVATYLIGLAGDFNAFYGSGKIVDTEDDTAPYRLFLTTIFKEVMHTGLSLLGIEVPEKM